MSWNSKEVKAKVFNFCELMKIPLKIPNFQRPYEWEKERVEQFLEDIIEIYQKYGKDDDFQYLIGSMVFYETLDNPNQNSDSNNVDCKNSENLNSKILEIVDGQQRLITLGLILYILGEENNKLVDLELEQSQKELSQKRIKENYEIIKNALRNFKDKDKKDLKDFIIKNLIITALITHDLDLAFFLFDAQNTRGKELTKKDLLKVHHIRFVDDEEYEEKRYLAKKWEYYESYKESENDKPKDKLNEILQYIGIARKGVRRELDPIDLIEVDVYKEFLSEDEEYKLNNYNQPPLFESFEYNPENNEIIFFTRNIPIKIPLGNIRDGWRYIPFEIPQSIEGGKRFFYFVIKYFNLYRELEEKHRDIFNVLDTATDTGNTYIRRIYKPLLLLYYDKFGENELKEYALRLLIILTYFRLIKSQIYNKTVVYSFSNKNGAKPESDDNFKGIDLFNLIFLSYSSKIVIEKLERYIKFEVSDILKDKSDKDKEKKVNLFVESMELGNNKNKNTKKQFINAWKNNFENEIKEVLKQCYRDWGAKDE